MHAMKLLSMLLLLAVASQPGFAQYKIGDVVIVVRDTDIKVGDKVLQKIGRGTNLRVYQVNGDWLWVSTGATGWITKQTVTSPSNAINAFGEQIRQNPQDAGAYTARGMAWIARYEFEIALGDFNEAIRRDPQSSAAFKGRGICWTYKGEVDKAIVDFSEAIRISPEDGQYSNRANCWNLKGEYSRAISDTTEAIRLNPTSPFAYSFRASAYAAMKEFDKAIADCEEARRIAPNGTSAYNQVAWFLATSPRAEIRDGKKAIEFATKACELTDWKDGFLIDTLATAHAEAADFDQAVKWETKALTIISDTDRAEIASRLNLFKSHKPYRQKAN